MPGPIRLALAGRPGPEATRPPALFLDRDGVLNTRRIGGYVTRAADLDLLEAVLPAARTAAAAGYRLVVVTNQGMVAKGLATVAELLRIHARLVELMSGAGLTLAGIYACPHHPDAPDQAGARCSCRKPEPGLFHAAVADLGLDPARSIMIGDSSSDVVAAVAAGVPPWRAVLVASGGLLPDGEPVTATVSALVSG